MTRKDPEVRGPCIAKCSVQWCPQKMCQARGYPHCSRWQPQVKGMAELGHSFRGSNPDFSVFREKERCPQQCHMAKGTRKLNGANRTQNLEVYTVVIQTSCQEQSDFRMNSAWLGPSVHLPNGESCPLFRTMWSPLPHYRNLHIYANSKENKLRKDMHFLYQNRRQTWN